VLATAVALALAVAACDAGGAATPTGATVTPPPTPRASEPAMTVGAPPSPTPPDESSPVVLDTALLEHLPEDVEGIAIAESMEEAVDALDDPGLPRIASGLDAGIAVDPASANLVLAYVVRLRDDAFTEDAFRQWRDSFDEGACAAAGGVVARAQVTLDERLVFVTSCVAGLRTYHLWLDEENLLISASSVGEGRFGEILMSTLRI
jgi:hypothetical protein